jgi:hypothetical protein
MAASIKSLSIIGSYQIFPGIQISVEAGNSQDYASTRAEQLCAVLQLEFLASGCEHSTIDEPTLTGFRWLASSLAHELKELIDIVYADAKERK